MTRRQASAALLAPFVARAAGSWQTLFDGRTTNGWIEITGKPFPETCWRVEDGCLKALRIEHGFQDIRTVQTWRSFEFAFEWKIAPGGNSGVKYLIQRVDEWPAKTGGRHARARGFEYQLVDDDRNDDAKLHASHRAGALYGVVAPSRAATKPAGEFNESRLVVRAGAPLEHWLNGVCVVRFDPADAAFRDVLTKRKLDAPLPGETAISLQNHASEAWFRNLRLREI